MVISHCKLLFEQDGKDNSLTTYQTKKHLSNVLPHHFPYSNTVQQHQCT